MNSQGLNEQDQTGDKTTFRYAIIGGGGGIADTHLKALAQLPGAQVVGLSDIVVERVASRAAQVGCPAFADHRAMLKEVKTDIAVVTTPHPSHAALVIDCLEAGTHVLVEKPMTVEVAQADAMIAAADAANRILAVSFQHRFRPVISHVKRLIEAGELGSLVRVLCVEPWFRTDTYYRSATWRGTWIGEAGGVLMNQGPHPLDLLCYLVGLPSTVCGWIRTVAHDIETEDSAQAMLEYPNGVSGYLNINTVETGKRRLEIVGDKAAIEVVGSQLTIQRFNPSLSNYRETSHEMWGTPQIASETIDIPGDGGAHLAVYQDLQAAIVEKRRPRCDAREARMSVELANAITLSSFTGARVPLPLDGNAYNDLLSELRMGQRTLR
ncbi:MAG TPA: Gfo/Idh/MocA family oxidoreductase [Aggregatilineales bacterium]|nr:Gfo/Idh/MocA family oxidoreductase [Aggregatilineales bacterium]